ncbi:N-6 DNA methylase [Actinotalea sp. C106]|uniref:N-6 DNA methylase n=1 Tax=Actinotalea sp. C106 TaxID=2908644 RepID=UPI0020287DDB|nr:N-6 DNA methylase [Actinotalea sp. C106]
MTKLRSAVDTVDLRKARGAFFTPQTVAAYVTRWAVRETTDTVLEPSCGEAAFLIAAHQHQTLLDPDRSQPRGELAGVELHDASARAARELLSAVGATADIKAGDFFSVEPRPTYDAVIGNPPYVRYQDFSGESRAASRRAALRAGVALTALASSWAAFTVHSALFLKPGGRLGLVLPAELLSVNYAAQVREFLMRRFGRVRLVLFTERVFPGVLEEVVLLLAEGDGGTDHCELLQVHNADDLADLDAGTRSTWTPVRTSGKWTSALLPPTAAGPYAAAASDAGFTTLHTWGETTLGMVTGANRYFALSPQDAARLAIPDDELLPLSPPGSRHLRGLSFTSSMRATLGEGGAATLLFRPSGDPSAPARRYIATGEANGVNEAYKCRVRTPWWRVPYLAPADLFLTYMNADTPRLTTNSARAHHLNSVHGVYLHAAHRAAGQRFLPLASLNSVTLLGAEIVGRAYGGGMLKIEPREADDLPMPAPAHVEAVRDELAAVRGRVAARLREGRLLDAVRIIDQVVLVDGMGMTAGDAAELEQAHALLTARRRARGTSAKDRISPHAGVTAGPVLSGKATR